MPSFFWLSLVLLLLVLASLARMAAGLRRVRELAAQADDLADAPPAVSVVVSALNEEATIEPALRTLLGLDYPALEVVAIDDRSTDATGAILDRLAAEDPRLKVLHIRELPAGWLGKTHALHQGAAIATGEYLLFTDADVLLERSALRRAVSLCRREGLDHLVVIAELLVKSPLLAILLLNFYSFMFTAHPPWMLRRTRKAYCGMGAFNLVRASAYRRIGGHAALKLAVVDDLMLGKRIKAHGFTQDAVLGFGAVSLEWYRSVGELVRGLEKNSYAVVDYSLAKLVVYTLALALVSYWPIAGLFLTHGVVWWLNLATFGVNVAYYEVLRRRTGFHPACLVFAPLAPGMQIYIAWRGVLRTLRRGGIEWRGTRYPLEDLRRAHRAA